MDIHLNRCGDGTVRSQKGRHFPYRLLNGSSLRLPVQIRVREVRDNVIHTKLVR